MDENATVLDARPPAEIASRTAEGGVRKARMAFAPKFALSVLGGAFIAIGACFATVVLTDTGTGYGVARLLAGLVFSLGLILVVLAGAELFTGNVLLIVAWASRRISAGLVLRDWAIVYAGNLVGALATAGGIYLARQWTFGGGRVGAVALDIAVGKLQHGFLAAVVLGAFCNALVCLAVWLCVGARSTADRVLAIVPPITAFVAMGFEHSVANMYFIPVGLLLAADPEALALVGRAGADLSGLTWDGFLWRNLLPVTLGNILGGGLMVGAVYWFIYLRGPAAGRNT